MKKKTVLVTIFITIALAATGCGNNEGKDKGSKPLASESQKDTETENVVTEQSKKRGKITLQELADLDKTTEKYWQDEKSGDYSRTGLKNKQETEVKGIKIKALIDDSQEYESRLSLVINGKEIKDITECEYDLKADLITRGENTYVAVSKGWSNDYVTAELYKVDGNNKSVDKVDEIKGYMADYDDENECFTIDAQHFHCFSTFHATCRYTVANDKFVPVDKYYDLNNQKDVEEENTYLTVQKAVPVTIDGKETTVPEGEKIWPVFANTIDTMIFKTENGQIGIIKYQNIYDENGDWMDILINNVTGETYFGVLNIL